MNLADYSVKKVRTFEGREGLGYNADLYRGNKKIASVIDDAHGGDLMINWLDRNEETLLEQHCATLPPLPPLPSHPQLPALDVDCGLFIEELVNSFQREKDLNKMRKQCLTKTLYRTSQCGYGAYYIMKNVCTDQIRQHLRTKHGNDVEIFNDVLARNEIPSVCRQEV